MNKFLCCIAALVLMLTGCATDVVQPRDAKGLYPTSTKLAAGDIKVAKPFQPKYRQQGYLLINYARSDMQHKFFTDAIKKSGVFAKTMEVPEVERLIVQKQLADKVSSAVDLVSLNKLQKEVGFFVAVDSNLQWKGGYAWTGSIKVQDPETGDTVLLLEKDATNLAGLDTPLMYPLVNAFIQWSRGESITTDK